MYPAPTPRPAAGWRRMLARLTRRRHRIPPAKTGPDRMPPLTPPEEGFVRLVPPPGPAYPADPRDRPHP